MKINKLFHWLYFTVMMLPIFILPIFALAVRSDNNYQPISVEVTENKIVNFNQLVQNGDFANNSAWTVNTATASFNNNICTFTASAQGGGVFEYSIPAVENHKLLFKCDIKTSSLTTEFAIGPRNNYSNIQASTEWQNVSSITLAAPNVSGVVFVQIADRRSSGWDSVQVKNVQLFDLTQMFGSGNEPSIPQFNDYFVKDYYNYTLSTNVIVSNFVVTYSDSDFGSQTVYTLYQGVNKFFNYDNVFNFGDLYSWLQVTFFGGNAPLGFFIFWHLLIYWLLTSILWLIFDVLMYIPQLVHRWLDKASLS